MAKMGSAVCVPIRKRLLCHCLTGFYVVLIGRNSLIIEFLLGGIWLMLHGRVRHRLADISYRNANG